MTVAILAPMAGAAAQAQGGGQSLFADDEVRSTLEWLRTFALAWHSEVPIRIHQKENENGGAPEFHPDFISWLERPCQGRAWCSQPSCPQPGRHHCHDLSCTHGLDRIVDARHRTHRAFRKLRRSAPREFDAVYLLCAKGLSFEEVAAAMTDRAVRLDKPERYSATGVFILAVSAVDKLSKWY